MQIWKLYIKYIKKKQFLYVESVISQIWTTFDHMRLIYHFLFPFHHFLWAIEDIFNLKYRPEAPICDISRLSWSYRFLCMKSNIKTQTFQIFYNNDTPKICQAKNGSFFRFWAVSGSNEPILAQQIFRAENISIVKFNLP